MNNDSSYQEVLKQVTDVIKELKRLGYNDQRHILQTLNCIFGPISANMLKEAFDNIEKEKSSPNIQYTSTIPNYNVIHRSKDHYTIEYAVPGFSREHVKTAKVYTKHNKIIVRIECEKNNNLSHVGKYIQNEITNVIRFDHDITGIASGGIDKVLAKVNDGILSLDISIKNNECFNDIQFI